MRQISQITLVARDPCRLGFLAPQLLDAEAVLGCETVEAPAPARLSVLAASTADDRRFDNQLFPLPRRSQHALDDRVFVRIDRRHFVNRRGRLLDEAVRIVERRRREHHRLRISGTAIVFLRYLPEREIFVEPFRRQSIDRTRQQCDEGSTGRIRPPRPPIEVGRDIGSGARMLDQAHVLFGRSQKHRHVIEANAARRLVEHASDDFDCLAAFAWRREEPDISSSFALRWTIDGEHELAQVAEIAHRRRRIRLRLLAHAHRPPAVARDLVAIGNSGQDIGRARDERRDKPLLRA